MSFLAQSSDIPNFLRARSPQGLRRAMIRNNAKLGMFIKYFDIQFVNGEWFAWYFVEIDPNEEMLKVQTEEVENANG